MGIFGMVRGLFGERPDKDVVLIQIIQNAEKVLPGRLEIVYGPNSFDTERDHLKFTPREYSSKFFMYRDCDGTDEHWRTYDFLRQHRLVWTRDTWMIEGVCRFSARMAALWRREPVETVPLAEYIEDLRSFADAWNQLYTKKRSLYGFASLPDAEYRRDTGECWYRLNDITVAQLYIILGSASPEYVEYARRVLDVHILNGRCKNREYALSDSEKVELWDEETYMAHTAEIETQLGKDHAKSADSLKEKIARDAETAEHAARLADFIKEAETHATGSLAEKGDCTMAVQETCGRPRPILIDGKGNGMEKLAITRDEMEYAGRIGLVNPAISADGISFDKEYGDNAAHATHRVTITAERMLSDIGKKAGRLLHVRIDTRSDAGHFDAYYAGIALENVIGMLDRQYSGTNIWVAPVGNHG